MHPVSLDLTRRHFSRTIGPIMIIGTWLRDDEAQWRPALVLLRESDELSGAVVPCVVPLNTAWVWSEEIGAPHIAARAAVEFARQMRFDDSDPKSVFRIAGLIRDHLDDLVAMPPLPPGERDERVVAEALIRDLSTGKTSEVTLKA
jgi:hypothetical protein